MAVRAEVSVAPESFKIPAVPDLIPDGPWKKVPGGVCAAKGFKATGEGAGGCWLPVSGGCWLPSNRQLATRAPVLTSRSPCA